MWYDENISAGLYGPDTDADGAGSRPPIVSAHDFSSSPPCRVGSGWPCIFER